jgi:hypothetical protein
MKLSLFLLVKKAQIHVHWVLCEDFEPGWEKRNHCYCLKQRRELMDYDFLIVGSGFGGVCQPSLSPQLGKVVGMEDPSEIFSVCLLKI